MLASLISASLLKGMPAWLQIGQFSYSWMNTTYPGGCLEQPTLTVAGSFFLGAWPTQP